MSDVAQFILAAIIGVAVPIVAVSVLAVIDHIRQLHRRLEYAEERAASHSRKSER
jgi:hypothetical protein